MTAAGQSVTQRARAAAAGLMAVALLSGCGSTVPGTTQSQSQAVAEGQSGGGMSAVADDGLSLPAPDGQPDLADAAAVPGGAPVAGTGSSPAGGTSAVAPPDGSAPSAARPPASGRQAPPPAGESGRKVPPMRIGFTYLGGDPFCGVGVTNPTPSDDRRRRWARAMAAEVNATGGFAGRKIALSIRPVDSTDGGRGTQERLQTEACVGFTEDDKVFMVIGTDGARRAQRCYVNHRTPVLMTSEMGSEQEMLKGRPWVLPNFWLNSTRMAKLLPHTLCEQGFTNDRVGVFAYDDPDTVKVVEEHMIPGLNRCGKVLEKYFASPTLETISQEIASAILQFRSAGVDRVAFLASGGGAPLLFSNQAESQGYRPWYGLSTYDRPGVFVAAMPEAQRANVYGAGVYLPADISQQRQPPLTPRERDCFEVLNRRAGENFTSRGNAAVDASAILALATCDLFWVTQQALEPSTGRALRGEDVAARFFALGGSYRSVSLTATRFTRARADAVDVYAPLRWGTDCQCMFYDGRWRRIPFD